MVSSSGTPAIRLHGVTKTFGKGAGSVRALSDVSLEVHAASITALLGPNGAGKSTLMLTAVGLVRPDAGRCEIFGRSASVPQSRVGLGFLPEDVGYEAGFTVTEILRLHARLGGRACGSALQECLERFGLRLPLSRRIARCSHGTARRLALACALVGEPRLLVLDEPTSGLDVAARENLLGELVRFRARGGSVLISSHVLSELEQVCDALAILDRGLLVHRADDLQRNDDVSSRRSLAEIYRRRLVR